MLTSMLSKCAFVSLIPGTGTSGQDSTRAAAARGGKLTGSAVTTATSQSVTLIPVGTAMAQGNS